MVFAFLYKELITCKVDRWRAPRLNRRAEEDLVQLCVLSLRRLYVLLDDALIDINNP
jgi:hypothetical protein